ncbi:MAG: glycosyltransferase [Spirochaetaceae bacterium]|jgi:glycosyltransferase involved in cell wall biosynthesis|nr:glycosyltransferase [Spirochaetaceae bacterium]
MKVAVVHYWLVTMRGGEKVLEALLTMFPEADIYTHVYDPKAVSPLINSRRVYTSSINRLPFARSRYQTYMPLMPHALTAFDLQSYELVISSESGPAKGVVPHPDAYHLCYCHSPMRYLWDMYHQYFAGANLLTRFFMRRLIPGLRVWDCVSANLVDRFAANSTYVAKRIKRYYNRDAAVVFPPVSLEKFLSIERKAEDFYLFFGQLAGYKRADLAIEACAASGRRLVVAGAGAKPRDVRRYEKSGLITFAGRLSDAEIAGYFSRAKALLFPGIEDFGIIPVEAGAAGCPVIAYRQGGVLDTIQEGRTGIFFDQQTPASLMEAMDRFERMEAAFSDRSAFTRQVQRFSPRAFVEGIGYLIEQRERR